MEPTLALTDPITKLLAKNRADLTREDLMKVIAANNIERITFHYTGLDGKLKELKIPVTNRRQVERVLTDGERVDGSSLFKGLVDVALSDLYVVPVYRSAFLNPFEPGSLDLVCRYLTHDGSLAPFAPDNVLANAHALFRKHTGLELHALGELEFFLLSPPGDQIYRSPKQRGYHASGPFAKSGAILNEMVRHIALITGAVKYGHSEVGYIDSVRSNEAEITGRQGEQLEVEFLPVPVEDAADHLVIARWLIRTIAYRHGCVATFTPKLEEGIAGNGMHIHMELRKNGRNIMTAASGSLGNEARQLIGGLCTYADSLTAFGNTVSSAYLRLVPNQEAPTRICWSDRNRSAMIRVPLGWGGTHDLAAKVNPQPSMPVDDLGGRQTVELRSPDGSAMAHLLLAGITTAADWGLTQSESLSIAERYYVSGNIFRNEDLLKKLRTLPTSCVASGRILQDRRELYERDGLFPSSVVDYVVKLLNEEDDDRMNIRLMDLPADDRLHETRKIMHKDLHRH
ncbi:MAG: glutamine synthetase family protein [Bacteroidetes bacterium]|jgi:glutamine synthetase|nr:glutamine synthetase family protein [Bacteroidota bacterium]